MTPTKKKASAKARVKFKDISSKKDPKGGCCAGAHLKAVGQVQAIKFW